MCSVVAVAEENPDVLGAAGACPGDVDAVGVGASGRDVGREPRLVVGLAATKCVAGKEGCDRSCRSCPRAQGAATASDEQRGSPDAVAEVLEVAGPADDERVVLTAETVDRHGRVTERARPRYAGGKGRIG